MNEAQLIFFIGQVWSIVGLVISVPFLLFGLDRIDESSRGSYAFRLLLVPGIILLWPIVLWRWYRLERGLDSWSHFYAPPRRHHGAAAVILAILVILILLISLSIRQTWIDYEPVRLSLTLIHEVLV